MFGGVLHLQMQYTRYANHNRVHGTEKGASQDELERSAVSKFNDMIQDKAIKIKFI